MMNCEAFDFYFIPYISSFLETSSLIQTRLPGVALGFVGEALAFAEDLGVDVYDLMFN